MPEPDWKAVAERALAALWEIRMTAERANIEDPVWRLPNAVKHLAEIGMGTHRQEAQQLAALQHNDGDADGR